MSTGLSNLIFSKEISENVKLELITKVLEKISPEMVVENLFSHSTGKDDYVYVLENIPRVGVFRDIKKAFWKKIDTLDEALIFEVTTQYIEKHAGNALPHEIKLVKEREKVNKKTAKMSKDSAPVGLAAINNVYKDYDNAREEAKSARLQRAKERAQKLVNKSNPEYSKGIGDEKTEETRKTVFNKLNPQQKKETVIKDIKDTTSAIQKGEKIPTPTGNSNPTVTAASTPETPKKENKSEENTVSPVTPAAPSGEEPKAPEVTTSNTPKAKTPSKNLFDQEIDKQIAKKEEEKKQEPEKKPEETTTSEPEAKPKRARGGSKPKKPAQGDTSTTNEPQANDTDAKGGKKKAGGGKKKQQTVTAQASTETNTSDVGDEDYTNKVKQTRLELKKLKLSKAPLDQVKAVEDALNKYKELAAAAKKNKKTKTKNK